jgi:hypothetical protein
MGYTFPPLAQVPVEAPLPATPPFWPFAVTYLPPNALESISNSGANQSGNSTSPLCHDDRDQFTPEYVTWGAGFVPTCFVFVQNSTAPDFQFKDLNQDDIKYNDHPNWAILASSMLKGLENILANYGPIKITSGYRSPYVQHVIDAANIAAGKYKTPSPHSQHLHGDAADLRALSFQAWKGLHDITRYLYPNACIEPYNKAVDHFHVDWRPWPQCAPSWQK